LKRLARVGPGATYLRFAGRSVGLVVLSLMLDGFGEEFKTWSQVSPASVGHLLAKLVKANLWEVLAIIGVGQLLIMPVIAQGAKTRLATLAAFLGLHVLLSYLFNFDFVFGRPNRLDAWVGTTGSTAWDGGVFGLLPWSALMLAGSLAYDLLVAASAPGRASARLLGVGLVLLGVGYGLSCLSMLYDGEVSTGRQEAAASPVLPPFATAQGRPWSSLLAEWPLVQPPPPSQRPHNYWMMNKRAVSLPFTLFAMGWATVVYGLFVLACDAGKLRVGLFRTFGQNALVAYVIHQIVEEKIHSVIPRDAPLEACLAGLAAFFAITYLFVRYLEKQGVYIRL
jgi:predicted acyltransferase